MAQSQQNPKRVSAGFDAGFKRRTALRCTQQSSILAAVFDSEVPLNHQPDERIGIVAEIIVGIVNRAAMEQICTAAILHRATRHNRPRHAGVPMLYLVASIGARPRQDGPAERESEHND
jgi:hypothetical protein